ncbi:MAG: response regulator [Candidatus Omnitrophota bacterium]
MTEEKVRILWADDEADFVEPISFWLRSKGYEVLTVPNGREAVLSVKENLPDILFLDLSMPVMSGLEALKEIRSFNKDLPVIMVSAAYKNENWVTDAKGLGISGFFSKSYPFDQLTQIIHVALRTHKKL